MYCIEKKRTLFCINILGHSQVAYEKTGICISSTMNLYFHKHQEYYRANLYALGSFQHFLETQKKDTNRFQEMLLLIYTL